MEQTKIQPAEPEGELINSGDRQLTTLTADTAELEPCTQQTDKSSEDDLDNRLMCGDDCIINTDPRGLAALVYPNPCPRCGSVEGQWRGRRNTQKKGTRHRRMCKECTRWQSI